MVFSLKALPKRAFIVLCGWVLLAGAITNSVLADSVAILVSQPRGGFGDVASNLVMAMQLRKSRPENSYTILFLENETVKAIKTLFPSFDPTLTSQVINGIRFYKGSSNEFDLFVTFSADELFSSTLGGKIQLHFLEYGDNPLNSKNQNSEKIEFNPEFNQTRLKSIHTGIDNQGLYISKDSPPVRDSASILRVISRQFGIDIPSAFLENETKVGFCYSFSAEISKKYIQSVSNVARRNPAQKYLVFAGKGEFDATTLPENLKVIDIREKPLELSALAVRSSNMPILVTGDVSLSLAFEYEKPFLYECNNWKKEHIQSWFNILEQELKLDQQPDLRDKIFYGLNLEPNKTVQIPLEKIEEFLTNESLTNQWPSVIRKFRSQWALPEKVFVAYDILKLIKITPLVDTVVFWRLHELIVSKKIDREHLTESLLKLMQDRDQTVEVRLSILKFLMSHPERDGILFEDLRGFLNAPPEELKALVFRTVRNAFEADSSRFRGFQTEFKLFIQRIEALQSLVEGVPLASPDCSPLFLPELHPPRHIYPYQREGSFEGF